MKQELTTLNHNSHATLLSPQIWSVMRDQAKVLVQSGFLPPSVSSPEKAIAIMMKGHEIGFPPMQAFAQINIIQGKPCISAEGQLSLIYKNCSGAKIDFEKLEDDGCTLVASRPGGKKTTFKFDRKDAEAAGLLNKDTWKKYPRAMYRSRCISEMARTLFPDAIMGLSYTAEELNPDVEVNENGEIIIQAEKVSSGNSSAITGIAAAKSASEAPKKQTKIFDAKDEKAVDWLRGILTERKLSSDEHELFIEAMDGKDFLIEFEPMLRKKLEGGQ